LQCIITQTEHDENIRGSTMSVETIHPQHHSLTLSNDEKKRILHIITENFKNGYRVSSNIHYSNFQKCYAIMYGFKSPCAPDTLDSLLMSEAIVFDDIAYVYSAVSVTFVGTFLEQIDESLTSVETLYEKYSRELYALNIFSCDILELFIRKYYPSMVALMDKKKSDKDNLNNIDVIEEIVEKCVIIKINKNSLARFPGDSDAIYKATRYAWKLSLNRVQHAEYVISVLNGIVQAVFHNLQWQTEPGGRLEFDAVEAPVDISGKYIGKRIPQAYRRRGIASPCQYVNC